MPGKAVPAAQPADAIRPDPSAEGTANRVALYSCSHRLGLQRNQFYRSTDRSFCSRISRARPKPAHNCAGRSRENESQPHRWKYHRGSKPSVAIDSSTDFKRRALPDSLERSLPLLFVNSSRGRRTPNVRISRCQCGSKRPASTEVCIWSVINSRLRATG